MREFVRNNAIWQYLHGFESLTQTITFLQCLIIYLIHSNSSSSYILRRPQNFVKSSPFFWLQYIQSKVRGRFRKILWPSQNIWTLKTCLGSMINIFRSCPADIHMAELFANNDINIDSFTSFVWNFRLVGLNLSDFQISIIKNRQIVVCQRFRRICICLTNFNNQKPANSSKVLPRVSVQGVESLWGDCRFIPADWGSQ